MTLFPAAFGPAHAACSVSGWKPDRQKQPPQGPGCRPCRRTAGQAEHPAPACGLAQTPQASRRRASLAPAAWVSGCRLVVFHTVWTSAPPHCPRESCQGVSVGPAGVGGKWRFEGDANSEAFSPFEALAVRQGAGDSWGQLRPGIFRISDPITCLEVGTASILHPSGGLSARGAGPGPRCRHFPLRAQGRMFLSFLSV